MNESDLIYWTFGLPALSDYYLLEIILMAKPDPLEGPKLKIERANAHIIELRPLVQIFCEGQPYTSRLEVEPDGQRALKVKFDPSPIPGMIPVIVGETLFQLRSALDHLVCALAIHNGAKKVRNVYFPTGMSKDHFESQAKKKIHRLSLDARAMVSALEPYNGGKGHWLRVVHTINLVDKHQALIPTAAAIYQTNASLSFKPGIGRNIISAPKVVLLFEKEITVMKLPASTTEIQGNLNVSIDIAFGDVGVVKGEPVLPSLKQFSELTNGIVRTFEKQFFA